MKVSIAICTYNGIKYLEKQLQSVVEQLMPAYEVICCDDGSTDGTLELLASYEKQYADLFRIIRNECRLGPRKNFEKAISLCTGGIIFLCDQDDIWHPEKIKKTADKLVENPQWLGAFSNGCLIDEQGNLLGETMWDALYFEPKIRAACQPKDLLYYILLNGNVATGTSMAIRKEAIDTIVPFFTEYHTWHDHWIALVLSATNQLGFIDDTLLDYRVHDQQQVGFPGRNKGNIAFRNAVQQTWLQHKEPATLATQSAHLAWALQTWERFSPAVAKRITTQSHWQATGQRIKLQLNITKQKWLRQSPWFTRKIKLLKHWLKGGEYLRISFYDFIRI